MTKNNNKKSHKRYSTRSMGRVFHRFFYIPDIENVIDRHRSFVFIFLATFGILTGILAVVLNSFIKLPPFSLTLTVTHLLLILLLVALYVRHNISLYAAVVATILVTQFEVSISMIGTIFLNDGVISVTNLLINTTWLSMLLILSIATYIRFFPYLQLSIVFITLGTCAFLTKSLDLLSITPILGLAFGMVAVMGDFLIGGVRTLQHSKDSLNEDQNRIFEFLNMNKEELFQLIKLTQRKKLSDRQKNRLIELLDEQTRTTVLDVAADVVEKKQQNLLLLDNRELGLSPYEKEICLLVIKGLSIAEIARKLNKTSTSIMNKRARIRAKLSLDKDDNLNEALQKLVGGGDFSPSVKYDGEKL